MQPSKPVRTYLDPDAVGPLPRSVMADDSDQLAAARTLLRIPGTSTVELHADDVIDVFDPNRRPSSLAPLGYDTAIILPRHKLGRWVVAGLAGSLALLVAVAVGSMSGADGSLHAASAPAPPPALPQASALPPPAISPPAPASTVGTLLVDGTAGQRVLVDGVVLSAPAALLRCGLHEVAVGSSSHRTIDVPCGGEITVYR